VDLESIRRAIADVRSDGSPINWALAGYQGDNTNDVALIGAGEGGVNELIPHLNDRQASYGLLRITERFDNSDTVKFVFIRWTGENIHRMLRARKGTHEAAVKEIFAPYHVTVDAENLKEISEDIITTTVSKASGTAVHVREAVSHGHSSSPVAKSPGYVPGGASLPKVSAPPKATDNVKFHQEDGIRGAIQDLRSDATPTNWVLLTYDGPNSNTITLLGSGSGGSAELIANLQDDMVGYGLVRQEEKYDDSVRVMFAYINWVGEGIHRMLKARLGTHSGAVKGLLAPYHADIDATKKDEVTPEIITTTIQRTMGTASRVLEKNL